MSSLIWTRSALRDIQRLYRFLLPIHHDAAKRAVSAIRQGLKVLAERPGLGRPVEEMDPSFREWLIDFGDSGYIVLYRQDGANVVLLAVRHQTELGFY